MRELDAIKRACEMWGAQKLRMILNTEQGWARKSLTERFKELHDGAGSRSHRVKQFTEEALTGDGLLVHRAICGVPPQPHMPYDLYSCLFVHYVIRGYTAKEKASVLDMKVPTYWKYVGSAETWIAARLPAADAQNVCMQRYGTG